MSKKVLFSLFFLLMATIGHAAGLPTVSTGTQDTWYLLQFLNGGKVIAANRQGEVAVAAPDNSKGQWWKLAGDATQGYTLTNKLGYVMQVSSAVKNQKLKANATAQGVSTFFLKSVGEVAYEIFPKGNEQIALNLWGGPAGNNGVGLWDKADPNNPIAFVSEKEYKNLGRISIVPYPQQLDIKEEGLMALNTLENITYPNEVVKGYVSDFAKQLEKVSGKALRVLPTAEAGEAGSILLQVDKTQPSEGYTLDVLQGKVLIKASADAGFFYAIQSLKQLLPRAYFAKSMQKDVEWGLPWVSIVDAPKMSYRGFMLDVARHFFTKEEVMRIIDIMSLYKMNRFHWHLTEDQGWRIEMPNYPRLTEVGAIRARSYSNPGEQERFFDDTEYGRGMFYTKADLKEVVAYAKARNIEILPEVDLPGHMVAAIAAYPEFSCDPTKKYEVRVEAGISHDVLNIGDDKVIKFLEDVMDYLSEVFPYPYIHLGGDECPTDQWKTNAQCLERVKQHNLKGVNELQSWLVNHLGKYLEKKHKKGVVVWDELMVHWNRSFPIKPIVMAWNIAPDPGGKFTNRTPAQVAADFGFQSIYVPWNRLYLDWMQAHPRDLRIDEPYHGGWGDGSVNSVKTVYDANPLGELSGREQFGLGIQGNLWTETTNDAEEMEYQVLPRLLALSESGWLSAGKKNWTSFHKRLQSQADILDALGYTYAKHFIEPKMIPAPLKVLQEAQEVLNKSVRGGVGYASAKDYDALQATLQAARPDIEGKTDKAVEQASTLRAALTAFKKAAIVQPEAGKTYQIRSASTYYKRQFAGSSLYQSDDKVRIHYTPQVEPEELWQFVSTTGGYFLKNVLSGKLLQLPTYGENVALHAGQGTALRIDKATQPNGGYNYIPGVVVLSSVQGYKPVRTGNVKRLNATLSGDVNALDSLGLCHSGTWTIAEVTDFTEQLKGLSRKADLIVLTARAGEMGQPTAEALDFLRRQVAEPVKEALKKGGVTEEVYKQYLQRYAEFAAMERVSILSSLSTEHYYRLRNVWFPERYAGANASKRGVESALRKNGDSQLWSIVKRPDGKIHIYNKATGTAAYLPSSNDAQALLLGKPYAWSLEERTLDGKKGICIIEPTQKFSWYTNPATWTYVLMKPFWGACTWEFEKTAERVPTAIGHIATDSSTQQHYYDLSGRRVEHPAPGIYVNARGEKVCVQ